MVFNRGFSADHSLALVPDMIDETVVYCETLRKLAFKGTMFYLDSTTLRFTIDVIGRTILYVVGILCIASIELMYEQKRTLRSSARLQHVG